MRCAMHQIPGHETYQCRYLFYHHPRLSINRFGLEIEILFFISFRRKDLAHFAARDSRRWHGLC